MKIITFFLLLFHVNHLLAADVFMSLRAGDVNIRKGPDKDFPVDYKYHLKYMPVKVLSYYNSWYKVADMDGDSGWVHEGLLSKRNSAFLVTNNEIEISYAKPSDKSRPLFRIENGALLLLDECDKEWCRIFPVGQPKKKSWILRNKLWGRLDKE